MKIIDNGQVLKIKVISVDGRIATKSISFKDFIDKYMCAEDFIDEVVGSICNHSQSTESGFDPCDCAELFWETDNENISVELGYDYIEVDKIINDINTTVEEMDFTVRAYNSLKRYGVNNLDDLLALGSEGL